VGWGGDDLATGKGRRHVSFRELARREDLFVSYSFISNSLALLRQLELMPPEIGEALSWTHHKLLIPVKDPRAKLKLATQSVERGMAKREFEMEVRRIKDRERKASAAGRPPLPVFVKGLKRLSKAVALADSDPLDDDVFDHFSPVEAKKLLLDLEQQLAALQMLKARVEKKIESTRHERSS